MLMSGGAGEWACSVGRFPLSVLSCALPAWLVAHILGSTTEKLRPDSDGIVWLCRPPRMCHDPCTASLKTTVVGENGSEHIVDYEPARNPPIDCFYVYPNITHQRTNNANLDVDPQGTSIAESRPPRFPRTVGYSHRCTGNPPVVSSTSAEESAGQWWPIRSCACRLERLPRSLQWRSRRGPDHWSSQGSFVLTQLLVQHIDRVPPVRRLLVSAILTGTDDVSYEEGFGPLTTIGPCQTAVQTGCIVDYNAYAGAPPNGATFGGANPPDINGHAVQVICTNPANLSGGSGPLISMYRLQLPTKR